jgi:hypothetical protein
MNPNILTLGYRRGIAHGLEIDFSLTYENRGMLENNSDFSLFKTTRRYTENVPVNPYLAPGGENFYPLYALRDMRHGSILTRINYTPFMKYRVMKGVRIPEGSDWPTFTVTWRHGINEFSELTDPLRHYDMLSFEAARSKDLGAFREFKMACQNRRIHQ